MAMLTSPRLPILVAMVKLHFIPKPQIGNIRFLIFIFWRFPALTDRRIMPDLRLLMLILKMTAN